MKFNQQLKADLEKYISYVIIVEGKKDVRALKQLGFQKVYAVHEVSVPLRERLLEISRQIGKKDRVCILTDFDKKGRKLYELIKTELPALGVRMDNTLRGILLKAKISHIEGISSFMEKIENFS